ncbi:MAG: hydrogenase nickel incorporation protein HypB [Pseudomonadota bacterium]
MCGICGCSQHDEHSHHVHHHDENIIKVEQNILATNQRYAEDNAAAFKRQGVLALNLLSSPGSGKTSLLEKTIMALKNDIPFAVIEGDQYSSRDADRIRRCQVPTEQINTGKTCHLDAHHIAHAADHLQFSNGILMIENVGNLVCPALFALGEAFKIVILSTTEGEDKPLKYQEMFAQADLLLINKIDLLPYLDFNVDNAINYARQLAPQVTILQLSVKTGAGMTDWYHWLQQHWQQLAQTAQSA